MAVELKKGQKVNLKKKVPIGEILINLNWDQPKKRFLFGPRPIDLDLGCLYELKNGRKGTVQARVLFDQYVVAPVAHLLLFDYHWLAIFRKLFCPVFASLSVILYRSP